MDGTATDGRKGIPYLRDHFDVAALAALAAGLDEADDRGHHAELDDLAPAPA